MNDGLNILVAFAAGLVSFFSPCIIVVLPVFLASLAGVNLAEGKSDIAQEKGKIIWATWLFVIGYTFAFSLSGALSVLAAEFFASFSRFFAFIGGLALIFFGLLHAEIIKLKGFSFNTNWLKISSFNIFAPLITGITIALAWSVCIEPILSAILLLASQSETALKGAFYLFIYSLGLMIPIVLTGYFITSSQKLIYWVSPRLIVLKYITAIILIATGLLVMTGNLGKIVGKLLVFF